RAARSFLAAPVAAGALKRGWYTGLVPTPLLAIGPGLLSVDSRVDALGLASGDEGAIVTFVGLVRNHNLGRTVRYLEYEGYEPLALRAFERIASGAGARRAAVTHALDHTIR